MRIYKISNQKASYVGNCSDSFDIDSGDCLFDFFRDVSDFACKEEEIREQIDEGREILLSLNDFSALVDIKPIINKNLKNFEFYFYPQAESSTQVYVAYDLAEDIHYFFK
jgi:hypothetical protein